MEPRADLAQKALPEALINCLTKIFSHPLGGVMLAGGTALSGFYAGHRRSDDLDFFTQDEPAQKALVQAIRALGKIGVELEIFQNTENYFSAVGILQGHSFQITAVLDENLFRVGKAISLPNGIVVADLEALFMMKAATLVSRASEKDLYDLVWLFQHFPQKTISDLIKSGHQYDGGVNGEAILASVGGAVLKEDACDFSLNPQVSKKQIFHTIEAFRQSLLGATARYLEASEAPPLGKLVKALEKLR